MFNKLSKEDLKQVIVELETEIFKKHPEADHFYRKRVIDTCENIKVLKNYKDIGELIAIKKKIQMTKLVLSHNAFKEAMVKIDE